MVHVFTSRKIQIWSVCSFLRPCVGPSPWQGGCLRTQWNLALDLYLLVLSSSLHQLDLKWALTEAQVLRNSGFPWITWLCTCSSSHILPFHSPALTSIITLRDVDLTQITPLTKEHIRRQILQAATWLGDTAWEKEMERKLIFFSMPSIFFSPPSPAECSPHRAAF